MDKRTYVPADSRVRSFIRIILEKQFDPEIAIIVSGISDLNVEFSRRTGRIKNVYVGGERLLTLRANDGWFTITPLFAEIIISNTEPPRFRVVAEDDLELKGSLLAPGVLGCDPDIRPGDEVVIVNSRDRLIGVGRARLSCIAMKNVLRGEAVRVRWSTR